MFVKLRKAWYNNFIAPAIVSEENQVVQAFLESHPIRAG